jgi:invasion protein IalB
MLMTLPLGLNLTEPVLVKVDNGTPERLIAAMRTGGELKITVQDANKKPIDLTLPLLGFGLAFDKAK